MRIDVPVEQTKAHLSMAADKVRCLNGGLSGVAPFETVLEVPVSSDHARQGM